jgi:cell division transport system permease protein
MVSLCLLFFENLGRIVDGWEPEGRAMVYLTSEFNPAIRTDVEAAVQNIDGVIRVMYVSKEQALERLKSEMTGSTAFLDTLTENPLPHALEIRIQTRGDIGQVAAVVARIEAMPMVESVVYGEKWLDRFFHLFRLFRMTGYAVGGLFLLIAFFITASTGRLVFHARQSEVEIMRLVGATDRFIKMPFYMAGLIQGAVGSVLGLAILYIAYQITRPGVSRILEDLLEVDTGFLPLSTLGGIWIIGTFLGWFGCYLSLRQLLK